MTTVAIGEAYATRDQLKRRQAIPDTNTYVDSDLDDALASASRQVDRYCGRQFGRDEVASDRTFPVSKSGLATDDFWTTDDLAIAGTAWLSNTNFVLEPSNGIIDGQPGWPYSFVSSVRTAIWAWPWTLANTGGRITVTAKWGWESVPADIVSATLMLAAEELKLKDTPFGVAGFGDFAIRVRSNPKIAERLDPYRRNKIMAA